MYSKFLPKFAKVFSVFGVLAFFATGVMFLFNADQILSLASNQTLLASQYLAGRNFAVSLLLFAAIYNRERKALAYLLYLIAAFEAFDAAVGIVHSNMSLIVPSAVFAVGFLLSATYFIQDPAHKNK